MNMGFLKRTRKSKSRSLKEPKGYAWPKSSSHGKQKLRNKLDKTKYTSAASSKSAKNKNVRMWMYTFSSSTKNNSFDDDSTISESSGSSEDVDTGPRYQYHFGSGSQGVNLKQIQTRPSPESVLSGSSVSSCTTSSDDSGNLDHMELRDDETEVIIGTNGNRDEPDFGMTSHLRRRSTPPLLPPPRRYASEPNTNCSFVSDDQQPLDTVNEPCLMLPTRNRVMRNKSLPSREIRRNASEESKGFVHVFHQPLPPLDEEISLYDSGNDADDEFLDECSETSAMKTRNTPRRGSMSSIEDECDLRHRWEYGLAMTAKMGSHEISHQHETLKSEDSINTLSYDNSYDEEHAEEI